MSFFGCDAFIDRNDRFRSQNDVRRLYLEQVGILTPTTRELVLDRVIALDNELDTEQFKWVVLIVLHSHPGEENAYAWLESIMFDENVDYIQ